MASSVKRCKYLVGSCTPVYQFSIIDFRHKVPAREKQISLPLKITTAKNGVLKPRASELIRRQEPSSASEAQEVLTFVCEHCFSVLYVVKKCKESKQF